MSQINFDDLAGKNPKLDRTLRLIGMWLTAHADVETINSTVVADAIREDPKELARALWTLVDSGVLRQYYQLQTPQGVLVGPLYDEPTEDLPPTVEGRFLEPISSDDCLLVPVFKVTPTVSTGRG